jgi:hypothetical protein
MPLQSPLTPQGQQAIQTIGTMGAKHQDRLQRERAMMQSAAESHRDYLESSRQFNQSMEVSRERYLEETRQFNETMGLREKMWLHETDEAERKRQRDAASDLYKARLLQQQVAIGNARAAQAGGLSADGVRRMTALNEQLRQMMTLQGVNLNAGDIISEVGIDGLWEQLAPQIFSSAPHVGSGSGIPAARQSQIATNAGQAIALSGMGIPDQFMEAATTMYFGNSSGPQSNAFYQTVIAGLQGGNPGGIDQALMAALTAIPDMTNGEQNSWISNLGRVLNQTRRIMPNLGMSNRSAVGARNLYDFHTGDADRLLEEGEETLRNAPVEGAGFWGQLLAGDGSLRGFWSPGEGDELSLPPGEVVREGESRLKYLQDNLGEGYANMIIQSWTNDITGGSAPHKGLGRMGENILNGFIGTINSSGRPVHISSSEREFLSQGAQVIMSWGVDAWEKNNDTEAWKQFDTKVSEWIGSRPESQHLASMFLGYFHDNLGALSEMFTSENGGLTGVLESSDFNDTLSTIYGDDFEGHNASRDIGFKIYEKADALVGGWASELTRRIESHALTQEKMADGLAASMGVAASVSANIDMWKAMPTEENAYTVLEEGVEGAIQRLLDWALTTQIDEEQVKQFQAILTDPDTKQLLDGRIIMEKVKEYTDAQLNGDIPDDLTVWSTNPLARAIVQGVAPVFLNLRSRSIQEEQLEILDQQNLGVAEALQAEEEAEAEIDKLIEERIKELGG